MQLRVVTDSQTLPFRFMCAPSSYTRENVLQQSAHRVASCVVQALVVPCGRMHHQHGLSLQSQAWHKQLLISLMPAAVGHIASMSHRGMMMCIASCRVVSRDTGTVIDSFDLSGFEASSWDRHHDAPGTVSHL